MKSFLFCASCVSSGFGFMFQKTCGVLNFKGHQKTSMRGELIAAILSSKHIASVLCIIA